MNALLRKQKDILRNYNYSSSIKYPIPNFRTYVEISCIGDDKNLLKRKNENLYKNKFTQNSYSTAIYNNNPVKYILQNNDNLTVSKRSFSVSGSLYETQPSKVEATIQTLKNKQKEKEDDAATNEQKAESVSKKKATIEKSTDAVTNKAVAANTTETAPVPVKKSLRTKIWEEIVHYYHGFRLLFIDINICRKLLFRVLMGKSLTRREHRLLIRTTSDLFRLVPFSVFIIVPFMELLLPVFIKFFPGMLPSTFETKQDREAKLKQSLQIKLEVAKFLQQTLDEMSLQHSDRKSEEAKAFAEFFKKIKDPNEHVTSEEIIKFSKRFEDEVTLESLSKNQLMALCRILDMNTIGTSYILRFNLLMKLRKLAADDKIIAREGVDALNLFELQQACRARGMRAYGISEFRMRRDLQEWIDLSLNEKVPSTLLLLSRAVMTASEADTADKLKDTIRSLPESLGEQTKASIGELEGKVDNKTKIEIVKEELKKISEEQAEHAKETKQKEELVDKAPMIDTCSVSSAKEELKAQAEPTLVSKEDPDAISSKDVRLLSEALTKVSDKNKTFAVEKETINKIKEEIQDYKDDLEEFEAAKTEAKEDIKESRGAQLLYKKVDRLVNTLNKVVEDLEKSKEAMVKKEFIPDPEAEERVKIRDLIGAIKQLKTDQDEAKLKAIENVLTKIDVDRDGEIKVEDILNIVESLGKENVKLNQQQIGELVELIEKEKSLEAEEKIQKALAKSIKEEQKQQEKNDNEDQAKILEDKAEKIEEKNAKSDDKSDVLIDKAPNLKDKAELIEDKSKNLQDKTTILLDTTTELKEEDITSRKEILNVNEQNEEFKELELKRSNATGSNTTISSSAPIPPTSSAEKPKDKLL